MPESIEYEIRSIIAEISGFDEVEITPDKNFFEDLEIDSIKAIEITVAIEKKFRIAIRDEDVPNITTVQGAVDLVAKVIEARSH